MAAELGLLSLNQLQKLAQSKQNHTHHHHLNPPGLWMWNPKAQPHEPDDDSWEVRAFAEDTGNSMGTTWPPRSYTCTFCRREFRSAQALGGHMNVHRRDRARLHQSQPPAGAAASAAVPLINQASSPSSTTQEFSSTNSGLCLLYQLPSPNNGVFISPPLNDACSIDSPSTLLSISPYSPSNNSVLAAVPSINFPATPPPRLTRSSSLRYSTKAESPTSTSGGTNNLNDVGSNCKETSDEDLDLELRLGHSPKT